MVDNNDITNFIAQTIEIGGLYSVGCDKDKFITSDDKPVTMKLSEDSVARPLAVYGTLCADAYIINPFNEGEASAAISNWYYSTRNLTISAILVKTIIRILEAGQRAHGKNAKEEDGDALCAKYLGKYTSKIDEKMLKEFTSLSNSLQEFCSIFYNKSLRTCRLNCLIFKKNAREHYTNVRKSSWEVFEYITKAVLGCKSIDDFDYEPENPNIPVFESFINIYVELMKRLETAAKLVDIDLSNWETIKKFLPYLDQYYQQAKWCTDSINHAKNMYAETANNGVVGNTVNNLTGDVLPTGFGQVPGVQPVIQSNTNDVLPPGFGQPTGIQPFTPVPSVPTPVVQNNTGDVLPPGFGQMPQYGYR